MIIDFPENYFPLLAPAKCIYIIFDCLSAVIDQGNYYKNLGFCFAALCPL